MQITKNKFFICVLMILFSGCTKLAHLQELLILKAVSDNRELQRKYVEAQDKNFEKLLAAFKSNRIQQFTTKKQFLKEFGEPIFSREAMKDGQTYEQWLYRYPVKYFDSEKIYLYFDDQGKLSFFEYEENKKVVSRQP